MIFVIPVFLLLYTYRILYALTECVLGEERFYILTPIDIILAEVCLFSATYVRLFMYCSVLCVHLYVHQVVLYI